MRHEGKLIRTNTGRWEIVDEDGYSFEITSGDVIELHEGESWVPTRVEFDMRGYFAVNRSLELKPGLEARLLAKH